MSHNYIGRGEPDRNREGGLNYIGHNYIRHNYIGRGGPDQNREGGHNYISHNYIGRGGPSEPTRARRVV